MAAREKATSKTARKIDTKKKKPVKKAKPKKAKTKKAVPVQAAGTPTGGVDATQLKEGGGKKREKQYRFLPNARKNKFLNALAKYGSIKTAALEAEIDRTTHYTWMDDETYRKAYERARQIAADALEEEARRRAVEGYIGKDGVREYSDKLLIALLKANFPDRYKERVEQKTQLTGADGGAIVFAWEGDGDA